jgi:hypothetical protein
VRLQPGPMAAIHATSGTATIGFGRVDLEVREICPSQQAGDHTRSAPDRG